MMRTLCARLPNMLVVVTMTLVFLAAATVPLVAQPIIIPLSKGQPSAPPPPASPVPVAPPQSGPTVTGAEPPAVGAATEPGSPGPASDPSAPAPAAGSR